MNKGTSLFFSYCLAMLFSISLPTAFAKPSSADIKMTQNIDAIEVTKASPTFTIRLSSNPKSDVRWFLLDNNASFFPSIKQKTIVVSDNTAYEEWTFTLSRSAFKYPHVAQLRFVYAKPQDMSSLTLTQTEQKIFTIAIVS